MLPGRYHIGLLMDAACHLLDLDMEVKVHQDPIFIPFSGPQVFTEMEFLKSDVVITIKVHIIILTPSNNVKTLFISTY